jgi:cell division protease FtsH
MKMVHLIAVSLLAISPFSLVKAESTIAFIDNNQYDIKKNQSNIAENASHEDINELYAKSNEQLSQLGASLDQILKLAVTGKLPVYDVEKLADWIDNTQTLIEQIQDMSYHSLQSLSDRFMFQQQVITIITDALESKLDHLSIIAVDQLHHKKLHYAPSLKNLHIFIGNQEQHVQLIETLINDLHLSWYNHLYTNAYNINKKYHISSWLKMGCLTAGGCALMSYLLPYSMCKNIGTEQYNLGGVKTLLRNADHALATKISPQYSAIFSFVASAPGFKFLQGVENEFKCLETLRSIPQRIDATLRGTPASIHRDIKVVDNITLADPLFNDLRENFKPFYNIISFMQNPHKYAYAGMNITKSLLLVGPSGSGKSFAAEAFSGSISEVLAEQGNFEKASFLRVDPMDFFTSDHPLQEKIKEAQAHAPCILFIDEIHLLGHGLQTHTNSALLSEFLTELDTLNLQNDPDNQIFLVAATNRPDMLDQALLRPGRFETVHFKLPDFVQRKNMLVQLAKKNRLRSEKVDFETLSALTEGASFSMISEMFKRAEFLAKHRAQPIAYTHFYQALNEVVRKIDMNMTLGDAQKKVIAAHQSGKTLAHLLLETHKKVESVTLYAPFQSITEKFDIASKMERDDIDKQYQSEPGMLFTYTDNDAFAPIGANAAQTECKILLAGSIAQNLLLGNTYNYKLDEQRQAYDIALKSVSSGINIESLAKEQQNRLKQSAYTMLANAEEEAKQLLNNHKEQLATLSQALQEKLFLTKADIDAAI